LAADEAAYLPIKSTIFDRRIGCLTIKRRVCSYIRLRILLLLLVHCFLVCLLGCVIISSLARMSCLLIPEISLLISTLFVPPVHTQPNLDNLSTESSWKLPLPSCWCFRHESQGRFNRQPALSFCLPILVTHLICTSPGPTTHLKCLNRLS
jgi:hypothetical protein